MELTSSGGSENRGSATRVADGDGDTMDAKVAGAETRVQLLNIDIPEAIHPGNGVKWLGPAAAEYLEHALQAGQRVSLGLQRALYGPCVPDPCGRPWKRSAHQ